MKIVSGATRKQTTVRAVLQIKNPGGYEQPLAIEGDVPEGADPREHALKYMRAAIIQKAGELAEAASTYVDSREVAEDDEIVGVE